ncbi:MAG: hypothetical protein ACO2PK_08730 [Armatimonadota bacterium]
MGRGTLYPLRHPFPSVPSLAPRPSSLSVWMASERVVLKIEHISILACSSLRELLPYNRLAGGTPISEYPPRPKSPSDAKNGGN